MKPDWKAAPEWAKYLAMDASGWWYWYENEPHDYRYRFIPEDGQAMPAFEDQEWRKTKEARQASKVDQQELFDSRPT